MAKFADSVHVEIEARNERMLAQLRVTEQEVRAAALREQREQSRQQAVARQLAGVEAEINDLRLRQNGQFLEADLAQARHHYDEQIAAAREHGDKLLANRLETLKKLQEARIESEADAGPVTRGMSGIGITGRGAVRLAAIYAVTRALRGLTDGLIEARNAEMTWTETTGQLLQNFLNAMGLRDATKLALNIRELITQEQFLAMKAEARAQYLNVANDHVRTSIGLQRQLRADIEMTATRDAERRDFLSVKLQNELAILEAERKLSEATRESPGTKRADEAARELDLVKQLATARTAQFEDESRDARLADFRARIDAVRSANDEIFEIEATREGRLLDIALQRIDREFEARLKAAREANNTELAERLEMLRKLRQQQETDEDNARHRREVIEREREALSSHVDELNEKMRRVREAMQRERAPLPSLDQNRFLTGQRQLTEQIDRAGANRAAEQVNLLKQAIESAKRQEKLLLDMLNALKNGTPIIIGDAP